MFGVKGAEEREEELGHGGSLTPLHRMAFLIGFVAALILYGGHYLLLALRIDDPCDASVVHGFCGMWGVWATGIFCTDKNVQYAGYPNVNEACGSGEQFGVQVVGSLVIAAWTIGMSVVPFLFIDKTIGIRVSAEVEEAGLDVSEHGVAPSYEQQPQVPSRFCPRLWTFLQVH